MANWAITRIFKETESEDEVFAAPVPYSPINFNGRLSVHYHVTNSSDVTVEIYDFSMNLVKRLADGKPRSGGSDYFESWDGYNDRGDMAATGIYYIKVSFSTGEEKWGRLAITIAASLFVLGFHLPGRALIPEAPDPVEVEEGAPCSSHSTVEEGDRVSDACRAPTEAAPDLIGARAPR